MKDYFSLTKNFHFVVNLRSQFRRRSYKQLNDDGFVVLKIDIDTPEVELPLVKQILEDKDGIYHRLIDQFYFEHHVRLDEMKGWWGEELLESVKDSLDLFYSLRLKGIPAHFWP